jgi:Kdo2-lipid IVA lauroyltransferase/acyltransferase
MRRGRDFAILGLIYVVARCLPLRVLQRAGRRLGLFCYRFVPVRRPVVLANLRAAFGSHLDERGIVDLARRFYAHLGTTLLEFCALDRLSRQQIVDLVSFDGQEHLDALRAAGRGAILVSGHFGNWELLGAALAANGYPTRYLVKSQRNQLVDRLQNDIRRRVGVGIIRTDGPTTDMVRALRRGEFLGLLSDQDAGNAGLFVEFLGRPASVFRGAAHLAFRMKCPILVGFVVRQSDGRHKIMVTEPIHVDPAWDEETAVRILTEIHTQRLEAMIRTTPEQYFWVHRRWKTRPPEETP